MGKYIFKAIRHYLILGLLSLFGMATILLFFIGLGKFVEHIGGLEVAIRLLLGIALGVGFLFWFVIEVLKKAKELAKEDLNKKNDVSSSN